VILAVIAAGAVAGCLGSLLGIGGGVFLVPFLNAGLGLQFKTAAAVSLMTVIATSSAVSAHTAGRQLINLRLGMLLEIASTAGGLMAGIAILSRTELLLVVLGGLFAVVTLSGIIQTGWFKYTRRRTGTGQRVFKMSPIHHHFELSGWQEITIIVRFWIIAGLAVAFGTGLFYAEFIGHG